MPQLNNGGIETGSYWISARAVKSPNRVRMTVAAEIAVPEGHNWEWDWLIILPPPEKYLKLASACGL